MFIPDGNDICFIVVYSLGNCTLQTIFLNVIDREVADLIKKADINRFDGA